MKDALPRISPHFQKPLGWLQGPDHPLQLIIMHLVLPSSLLMNPDVDYLSTTTSSSTWGEITLVLPSAGWAG